MRNDRHLALQMRKAGKSYKTIRSELGIPLSTLSDWFSREQWSTNLKIELIKKTGKLVSKLSKARWEAWRQTFRDQAQNEFSALITNPLFLLGLSLYWGEGDNKPNTSVVRLVNTDPRMVSIFCRFLREVIHVDPSRLRASLVLYSDLSDKKCKSFWSNVTRIPVEQFHKTQFIVGKHPTRRTSYGMCTVYGNHSGLKEKILTWTDLLYKHYQA